MQQNRNNHSHIHGLWVNVSQSKYKIKIYQTPFDSQVSIMMGGRIEKVNIKNAKNRSVFKSLVWL